MTLAVREFQNHMAELYGEKDRRRGADRTFLWLTEEVGELAEALRKRDFFAAKEELADVIAWTASIANLLGVDLADAIREKYPAGPCARCGRSPCACEERGN